VPINLLFGLIVIILIIVVPSLFPISLIVRILLWVIIGLLLLPFSYLIYLYYEFSVDNKSLQYTIWNLVIQKLSWNGQGIALDIGTGAGALAIELAKKFPESFIIGIDYWGKLWNYSKSKCEENAKIEGVANQVLFQKASASKLPFEDNKFDAIISNFVYHEIRDVKDKKSLIRESLRVLKKGGVFSLQDTFKNKKKYGEIQELIGDIKKWGIEEVNFIESSYEISIPNLLKFELKSMGLLYGVK